jgi:hypothetical protein
VAIAVVCMARSSNPTKPSTTRRPTPTKSFRGLRPELRSAVHSNIRCTRNRWASGTSHLAVVNSQCAHGLQDPFRAQAKAMARLARKSRSRRLERSISLILWCTSRIAPVSKFGWLPAWPQTLAERLKRVTNDAHLEIS